MLNSTDEQLIELINDRNTKALKVLYDRYNVGIFNFILRYTNNRELAEDVLQETFTRVWFASHTFMPSRGALKAWLFTISLNITRNEMSKKQYSYTYVDVEEVYNENIEEEEFVDPNYLLEETETKERIYKAIERLNPYLREVLLLKHFNGLKFREIAEMTNTPEGTLKARFHNAISKLKEILVKAEC
ncbi:MAG: sigma-70 family RNA polymerase sigma factor [bacterium]